MTIISVGRNGQEIGDYYLEGVQEGLASGFFLATDCGWYEGLSEWLPLNEIVKKLSAQPALPKLPPLPEVAINKLPELPKGASTRKIKQQIKPKNGEVTYVLKGAKTKKSKSESSVIAAWRLDPATEKQIDFLHGLGAKKLPANLTKGEAHDRIDSLLASGQSYNFLSPKQLACLHYYGFDPAKLDYEKAKTLLDRVHESPESFDVPEPWERAKYRLYPKLYPKPVWARPRGCLTLAIIALISLGAVFFLALRLLTNWQ
jgi:hypothetical protein